MTIYETIFLPIIISTSIVAFIYLVAIGISVCFWDIVECIKDDVKMSRAEKMIDKHGYAYYLWWEEREWQRKEWHD